MRITPKPIYPEYLKVRTTGKTGHICPRIGTIGYVMAVPPQNIFDGDKFVWVHFPLRPGPYLLLLPQQVKPVNQPSGVAK